jgi:hypothetical protein
MRLEDATIPIAPRTTAGCLDLAVRYVGSHLRAMEILWLIAAVPACAVIVAVDRWLETEALALVTAAVVLLASSPLGVLLGLAAAPGAFGEPFTLERLWRRVRRQGFGLIVKGFGLRLAMIAGLLLCGIPSIWIALATGFFVERACLRSLDRRLHDRRTDDLIKDEAVALIGRAGGIVLFCAGLWLMMFVTVDVLSGMLFAFPLFLGRIELADGPAFFFQDARVQAAVAATVLAVYPIGRLAWFFCYIDLRVRHDLWDLELKFAQETRRLEGTT